MHCSGNFETIYQCKKKEYATKMYSKVSLEG